MSRPLRMNHYLYPSHKIWRADGLHREHELLLVTFRIPALSDSFWLYQQQPSLPTSMRILIDLTTSEALSEYSSIIDSTYLNRCQVKPAKTLLSCLRSIYHLFYTPQEYVESLFSWINSFSTNASRLSTNFKSNISSTFPANLLNVCPIVQLSPSLSLLIKDLPDIYFWSRLECTTHKVPFYLLWN